MDDALTAQEQALLDRYGDFYRALISGKRKPETPAQARFIEAFHGRVPAETEHEIAFTKNARLVKARREIDAAHKAAELAARGNMIEDAPGQRSYPARLDSIFDSAADWASQNGFRGV